MLLSSPLVEAPHSMHQADRKDKDDETKELLRLAQKRFSSLLRSLPIGIAIIRSDGTIEAVNAEIVNLFGYEERELVGHNIKMILREPPWAAASDIKEWHAVNASRLVELQGRTKDQEVVPIDFGLRLLDTDTRERLVAIVQDVTERYLANQLKHEFYQMLNHDLRSPLTNVVLFLKMMEHRTECGTLTEFGRERLMAAEHNVERILRMVNGLLDIDRLESADNLVTEPVDIRNVIRESVAGVTEAASLKDIAIEIDAEDVVVEGNFGLLQQLLVNILSNALQHSAPGKPLEVTASVHASVVRVAVRDHGQGVPDSEKPVIFEKFKQGSQKKAGGYGLGLAICKEIVLQHGGTIGCIDAPDEGSIFWFEIPLLQEAHEHSRFHDLFGI